MTSTSSFFKGIFISVLESTGLSDDILVYFLSLGGLFSIVISSCVTGIPIVFVSVIASFVTVASSVDCSLDTFSLSSLRGMPVAVSCEASDLSCSSIKSTFPYDEEYSLPVGGESLINLLFTSSLD